MSELQSYNTIANVEYRKSLFHNLTSAYATMKDPFIKTNTFKTVMKERLQQVLEEYGLLEKLQQAQSRKQRLRCLNLSCGEGLYMHLFAELLDKYGLANAVKIYGLDTDKSLVSVGQEFCRVSKPPRPSFELYQHNLQMPLEQCVALPKNAQGYVEFDFIFGLNGLLYTPEAQNVLTRIYKNNLKPGGILYLREYIHIKGQAGWLAPHPALECILEACYKLLDSYNSQICTATALPNWLSMLGAGQIKTIPDIIPWGGRTQRGKDMMRDIILLAFNSGQPFIEAKLLTQAEYNEMMRVLYKEITPNTVGQIIHMDTLASKPPGE